jgi:drug/metabolite transporter (DMT)-like permease
MGRYTLLGSISILMWGSILPLVRLACEAHGVLATLVVAQGLAGVLGTTVMLYRGVLPRSITTYLSAPFLLRLALFVSHVMLIYSAVHVVERASMPGVLFCNYLWPTLVLVYSISFANLKVLRMGLFSLGISTALLALFVEFGISAFGVPVSQGDLEAYLLAFLAANSWGIYSAVTRRWGDRSGGSAVTPLFLLLCGVIGVGLQFYLDSPLRLGDTVSAAAVGVGLCNFIAYLCWGHRSP